MKLYRFRRGRTWHLRKDGQGGIIKTRCGMMAAEANLAVYTSDEEIREMPPGKGRFCVNCKRGAENAREEREERAGVL